MRRALRSRGAWALSALVVFAEVAACASSERAQRLPERLDAGPEKDAGIDAARPVVDAARPVDASSNGRHEDASGPDASRPDVPDARVPGDAASAPDAPIGEVEPKPGVARLRVANLVEDGPAVHVCVRAADAAASAPWLPVTGSAELGGLRGGLGRNTVTAYAPVPVGPIAVRVVDVAGGAACSGTALAESALSPLAKDELGTLVLGGLVSHVDAFQLADQVDPSPQGSRFRVVHAAAGTLFVDALAQGCTKVAKSVQYGGTSAPAPATGYPYDCPFTPAFDRFGYAGPDSSASNSPTFANVLVVQDLSGGELARFEMPAALAPFAPGSVSTAFLHPDPSASSGFGLLVCRDSWPSLDALTTCIPAPPAEVASTILRFANPSPTCSYDVYVNGHSRGTLGYLGAGAVLLPQGSAVSVGFVATGAADSGAPCAGQYTPVEQINRPTASGGVPGLEWVSNAAFFAGPGLEDFSRGVPVYAFRTVAGEDTVVSMYDAAPYGSTSDVKYDFGPVSATPDPALLTCVGCERPASLALFPSAPLGLYASQYSFPDGGAGSPVLGPARLIRKTSVPVVMVPDHRYWMLFAPEGGVEPTDVLVCDLTLPPTGTAPPACDAYALTAVP